MHVKNSVIVGLKFKQQEYTIEYAIGYVNCAFAGSVDTRKSLIGYVFTLFETTWGWKSNLQFVVVLSIIEAEYIAVTKAIKEALQMQGMIEDLGFQQDSMTIHCKGQSAVHLIKQQVFHERSKYIDVKLHLVRGQ